MTQKYWENVQYTLGSIHKRKNYKIFGEHIFINNMVKRSMKDYLTSLLLLIYFDITYIWYLYLLSSLGFGTYMTVTLFSVQSSPLALLELAIC